MARWRDTCECKRRDSLSLSVCSDLSGGACNVAINSTCYASTALAAIQRLARLFGRCATVQISCRRFTHALVIVADARHDLNLPFEVSLQRLCGPCFRSGTFPRHMQKQQREMNFANYDTRCSEPVLMRNASTLPCEVDRQRQGKKEENQPPVPLWLSAKQIIAGYVQQMR
jgi:hypothetical protein